MIIEDQIFEGQEFQELEKGTYEECHFNGCDFTNISLAFFKFENCSFKECNLSNISLNQASFQDCTFSSCKMTGINFEDVNSFLFGIQLDQCDLSFAYFAENDLTRCAFHECNCNSTQFIQVNAVGTSFVGSEFKNAIFENSNFSEADLSEVSNLHMDIENNKVKKMKVNTVNLPGLLDAFKLDIIE